MKASQVLCLCLLAGIACSAFAYGGGPPKKHYDDDDEDYKPPTKKYHKHEEYDKEYDSDYDKKPKCGPKDYDIPVCVDPHTGWCEKAMDYSYDSYGDDEDKKDSDNCKTDATKWCTSAGKEWCCCYQYQNKETVCDKSDKVCTKDAKCTGTSAECPSKKWYRNGTPCSPEGDEYAGLYTEVLDSEMEDGAVGLVAVASDHKHKEEHAKKHGWTKCHRCYEGHCKPFKFEWWSKVQHGKEHYKKAYGKDYEASSKKSVYEPQFYCKKGGSHETEDEH